MSDTDTTATDATADAGAAGVPAAGITVEPDHFTYVRYEAEQIVAVVSELMGLLGIDDPVHVIVDETTPAAKVSAELATPVDGASSDAQITIRAESGALDDFQRLTHFGADNARQSLGRMLLRARDRMRPDFADAPPDLDLTLQQNAAWDAYCAGRLERAGVAMSQQRWRYNYRNRFGFSDATDADFDRLWVADDLGWHDLPGT